MVSYTFHLSVASLQIDDLGQHIKIKIVCIFTLNCQG